MADLRRIVEALTVKDSVDNDKPLLPSDDDWEDRVAEILRGDNVNTELGRRMARDAIRVARGELNDEEFNERYRDEVMAVFQTSDWPPGDDRDPETDGSIPESGDSKQHRNDSE